MVFVYDFITKTSSKLKVGEDVEIHKIVLEISI